MGVNEKNKFERLIQFGRSIFLNQDYVFVHQVKKKKAHRKHILVVLISHELIVYQKATENQLLLSYKICCFPLHVFFLYIHSSKRHIGCFACRLSLVAVWELLKWVTKLNN